MASKGTRAIELLQRAGVPHVVHEYDLPARHGREREARPNYGLEAAAALGVQASRVYKTLVAAVDGRLALAVVPVTGELDLKRLAAALGGRAASLAEPAEAERVTGYVIGGISPMGGRRSLPVVIDASAADHETVLVSAGRRGLQVELAPADLARLTDGRLAPIGRTNGRSDLVQAGE